MRHGSLFSGIGGFDLAAEWMGWENVFHCEWNPFGQKILKHYWPNAKSYGDIDETDFTIWRGLVDVLSGGIPCQPYSTAGKRKGKEDNRHKWPQMLRSIREIQPRWVVGENVPGLLNWQRGMVLDEIKADLEAAGFEVFPPLVLPACGKNAPHRRDRVWIVAHSESNTCNDESRNEEHKSQKVSEKRFNEFVASANTNCGVGCERWLYTTGQEKTERHIGSCSTRGFGGTWQDFPTQPPVCSRDDGLSSQLAGIAVPKKSGGFKTLNERQTFGRHRNESIKGYGNAIVPQIAYEIFKAIEEFEKQCH